MKINLLDIEFRVKPANNKILWEYIASGKWETDTFQLLKNRLRKEDCFWDIGAWAGPLTLFAANLSDKVIAVEADPVIFKELTENVATNSTFSQKVECLPIAIAEQDKEVSLFAREAYGKSSTSLLKRTYDQKSELKCEGLSFNSLLQKLDQSKPTFIKMDIEGGEFSVLPTMEKGIQKTNFPDLLVAFHYDQLREHFWLKKLKSASLAKVMMKVEAALGLDLLQKECKIEIEKCLAALNSYSFVYKVDGSPIPKDQIFSQFGVHKNPQLFFTNQA